MRRPRIARSYALILLIVCVLPFLPGCARPRNAALAPAPALPASHFDIQKLHQIDLLIEGSISSNRLPGAVFWLEHRGQVYTRAYGNLSVQPEQREMTPDAIFDAASLTKVLATGPAVMALVESGQIVLDAPVATYLPTFTGGGREAITVRQLLTHTSGLRPGIGATPPWNGLEAGRTLALAEKPTAPPDSLFRYSDVNFILLGELVRQVSGKPLNQFCHERFYAPLGMHDTMFLPPENLKSRIAPTEKVGDAFLQGVVHDPTSRRLGGVAGHAGLFTTAADVARMARMILRGGELDGVRIFNPETVRQMIAVQTPANLPARGLSWDIDSPYAGPRGEHFPLGSFGHTGWTGCSIWIDPLSETIVILMANRNHPTSAGNVIPLRRQVSTLAAEAVGLGAL